MAISLLSPLGKRQTLRLNKLEFPSPKDDLCQDWLKLAQWSGKEIFFTFVNVFTQFSNYLPLEKGGALHLNKLESPSPKDTLCQVPRLAQWFWRRRWKCEKFQRQQQRRRRTTNNFWSKELTWDFGSGELTIYTQKLTPTPIS